MLFFYQNKVSLSTNSSAHMGCVDNLQLRTHCLQICKDVSLYKIRMILTCLESAGSLLNETFVVVLLQPSIIANE